MTTALIGFGANLSNPKQNFLSAVRLMETRGVSVLKKARLWSSPAWPAGSEQPDYINTAVKIEFSGRASDLLLILQEIEEELGRVRTVRNAARTLDLDLLTFGNEEYDTAVMTVPHPRMLERAFVLLPLSEIEVSWIGDLAHLPMQDINAMTYLGRW